MEIKAIANTIFLLALLYKILAFLAGVWSRTCYSNSTGTSFLKNALQCRGQSLWLDFLVVVVQTYRPDLFRSKQGPSVRDRLKRTHTKANTDGHIGDFVVVLDLTQLYLTLQRKKPNSLFLSFLKKKQEPPLIISSPQPTYRHHHSRKNNL